MNERRMFPRLTLDSPVEAYARSWVPARVIDISEGGVQLESEVPLRPGLTFDLGMMVEGRRLVAQVAVRRARAELAVDGRGGKRMLYRAGAMFTVIDEADRRAIASWIAAQPGSGEAALKEVAVA